ncbi:MAG: FAD-dependent oxidoreductase, partial [Candidatus Rokubacteria bacterium]|nr:FAD-dependent oxidoreductase [Candidatus Rokubacteria bacterium]
GLIAPSHSVPLAAPGVQWRALRWMLDGASPFYIKPRLDPGLVAWLWRFHRSCTEANVERALPVLRDMSLASFSLYRELAARPDLDFGFEAKGYLAVYRTRPGLEAGTREALRLTALGVDARALEPAQARGLEPSLLPSIAGAIHFPGDGHLVPDRFVRGLAGVAEKAGVTIRPATEALDFTARGRRIQAVETTRGSLACDEVVLAAGSWSPALARRLGLRLPVQAAKGYSVTYRRPPGAPRMPMTLAETRVAVTPMGDMLRLAGTLELAGLDLAVSPRRVEAVKRSIAGYLTPFEGLELLEVWRGLRPCTPDGLPAIGRPKAFDNLVLATGHAMLGVSLGPITGKLVSQLIAGGRADVDLAPLSPDRF